MRKGTTTMGPRDPGQSQLMTVMVMSSLSLDLFRFHMRMIPTSWSNWKDLIMVGIQ